MGDVVYYYVSFKFASATIGVSRKGLSFWRPRSYITKLREAYANIKFRIHRVLAKIKDPFRNHLYQVKWFKYPDSDNCWMAAKDLEDQ